MSYRIVEIGSLFFQYFRHLAGRLMKKTYIPFGLFGDIYKYFVRAERHSENANLSKPTSAIEYNTDWRPTLEHDCRVFEKFDHNNLTPVIERRSAVMIVDGEVLSTDDRIHTRHWAAWIQQLLGSTDGKPSLENALLMFAFNDKCQDKSVNDPAFFPSKTPDCPAPLWFDWDHLEHLLSLQGQRVDSCPEQSAQRQNLPMWRGSHDYLHVDKETERTGLSRVDILHGCPRLALIDFSMKYPSLLNARLSKLSFNEQKMPWWNDPVVLREKQWYCFDEIPKTEYYNAYQNVIVVDGIGAAFRLLDHFRYSQTVFLQEGLYLQYYYRYMKPWIHYVPLSRDPSKATYILDWAIKNQEECLLIGKNGRRFYDEYLSRTPSQDLSRKIIQYVSETQVGLDHTGIAKQLNLKLFQPPQ
jgi:hypothetical protein